MRTVSIPSHISDVMLTGRKTAMKFDLEKMFEETRRTAREYSEQITGLNPSLLLHVHEY